ncbi:MAG TPA: hypothetical protein VNF69_06215 [Burkholderiales bacterium]|nr:hypothetical protein [Burkholderiales bacterium]
METPPATADAFKVSIEAGDVVIEFGRVLSQAVDPAQASVAVTDRIVLPLQTAQRLSRALGEPLKQHAAALLAAEEAARRGKVPVNAPPDAAADPAALLLQLVGALDVPHQYERSFRVSAGGLLANRYLLTVDQRDLAGDARERVLAICDRLSMPFALRAAAAQRFATASCVHFGFEGEAGGGLCKLYLERAVSPEEARRARALGEPALLHLAFKWSLDGATQVTTQYLWHPALSAAEIEGRLARHVYRGAHDASLAIARGFLALVAGKVAAEQLQYLEVQEEGNGRRSFDLNLYNAGLQLRDAQALLYRMRDLHGVRPGQFQALYDQIKAKTLGHLAGGVHRNGQDFFNLYYGVAGFPRFNERLR